MSIRCKRLWVAIAAMCSAAGLIGALVFAQGVVAAQGKNPSQLGDQGLDSETDSVARVAAAEAATAGRIVLDLRLVHRQGRPADWAVVTYRREKVSTNDRPRKEFSEPELLMYAGEAKIYRCVFRSDPLADPRMKDWSAEAVELECVDLNGDTVDEVVVTLRRTGASWAPGCAFVFKLASDQLILLAILTSHYEVKIERLDGYNQPVIPVTFAIGTTLAHVAQPRWTVYYRLDGQRIILANSVLPQRFQAWPGTLKNVLTAHPDDPEIWYYLGVARRILGQGPESERAFAKARSLGYQEPDPKAHQAGIQVEQE